MRLFQTVFQMNTLRVPQNATLVGKSFAKSDWERHKIVKTNS